MSQVLEDIDGAEAIVDDILVWGKDIQEHDARVKKVLDRVQEVNLEEIAYVGHLLTKDGFKPDPEKIRAVQDMTKPSNTKELKTFLGFIQYLGHCIWYNQVSPVPVWKRSTCHIRPQTTGIYIQ
jgi:hypothetical protein